MKINIGRVISDGVACLICAASGLVIAAVVKEWCRHGKEEIKSDLEVAYKKYKNECRDKEELKEKTKEYLRLCQEVDMLNDFVSSVYIKKQLRKEISKFVNESRCQ